jgi:hypothetical protein
MCVMRVGFAAIRGVMIERAVLGVEQEMQQRVRMLLRPAGAHLHREQQERNQDQSSRNAN